jgi:hypothetical protein
LRWELVVFALTGILVGLAIGYAVTYEAYVVPIQRQLQDFSSDIAGIQSSLANVSSQVLAINSSLSEINSGLARVSEPAWRLVSITDNFSWSNPNTSPVFSYVNCSGFSRMFVYITIDLMEPATGYTTTFSLHQIEWHLYQNPENWTYARTDVPSGTLDITTQPNNNFNGSDRSSQGGAEFTVIGPLAEMIFSF